MDTSIGNNIRRLRKKAGLTQEALAQKLYVTRQTVSLWELGKVRPDVETLQKVADCFQVELLAVLYGPEHTPTQKLVRRLAVWAGGCGGFSLLIWGGMVLAEWGLARPEIRSISYVPVVGNAYLWMALYGCPLLAVLFGAALGRCLGPVLSGWGRGWRALWGGMSVLLLLAYGVGMTGGGIPWVSPAAWELQRAPWVFLPAGVGLYALGRIIAEKHPGEKISH